MLAIILASTFVMAYAVSPATVTSAFIHYDLGAARPYESQVVEAARQHGLDPEYVAAVIIKESCSRGKGVNCVAVNPGARGGVGERGLMQIHPAHFRNTPAHAFDNPAFNIGFGTALLRISVDGRQGNLFCAASAYNTGPGFWCVNARNYATDVMHTYAALRAKRRVAMLPLSL